MGQCKHWVGTLCFVRNRTKGARPPTHAKLTSGGAAGGGEHGNCGRPPHGCWAFLSLVFNASCEKLELSIAALKQGFQLSAFSLQRNA